MIVSVVYEKRTERVCLWMSRSEKETAQQLADREGISLSLWARLQLRRLLGLGTVS